MSPLESNFPSNFPSTLSNLEGKKINSSKNKAINPKDQAQMIQIFNKNVLPEVFFFTRVNASFLSRIQIIR
jgi:hypothetical protein